eukprot:gene515-990_t
MSGNDLLIVEQKTYIDLINEKSAARRKKAQLKLELQRSRDHLLKLEEDHRIERELAIKLKHQKDEEERLEKERIAQENETKIKTKKYFEFSRYERKIDDKDSTLYYGDSIGAKGAWLPHGQGTYTLGDDIRYEGSFRKGFPHGQCNFIQENGLKWSGNFINGNMDGIGVLTYKNGEEREILMRKNKIICDRNEIEIGKEVEINDADDMLSTGQYRLNVIVLRHVKNWTFFCRFQQEIHPREKQE